MKFGRFGGQFPIRFGGGVPLARKLYEELNQRLGTAYDTSSDSSVTAETSAEARLLAAAWHANERAANQLDSGLVTDFIPRWESILGLTHTPSDSLSTRRLRIKSKRSALGKPDRSTVEMVCVNALGSAYIGLESVPLANAKQRWPGNGYANNNWSTTAHVVVRVSMPSGMYMGTFLAICNGLIKILRDFIPDWATADWATLNSEGDNGFLLDDPFNLNRETFDS